MNTCNPDSNRDQKTAVILLPHRKEPVLDSSHTVCQLQSGEKTLLGYKHRYHYLLPEKVETRALVALHGFGTTGERTFRHMAKQTRQAGIPLYAPDLLGTGFSDKPDVPYTLDLLARLNVAFVEKLGLNKPILLGHSMGGKIAAATLALYPDQFSGLILVNTGGFSRYAKLLPPLAGNKMVGRLFRKDWFFHRIIPRTPVGILFKSEESRMQMLTFGASFRDLDLDVTGIRSKLNQIRLPTLVLWGADDPLLPPSIGARITRTIPGARLKLIDGAGHAPMKDQPDRLVDAIAEFLHSF